MNQKLKALVVAAFCSLIISNNSAHAQGAAFTYQGRLNNSGNAVNGSYDISFTLYATNTGGNPVAGPVTNLEVPVSDGLFTTLVDFSNGLTGGSNWLELAVSPSGANAFMLLQPRQQLTPAPYAVFAITASNLSGTLPATSLAGTVPLSRLPATLVTNNETSANLSGAFNGNGSGLTNLHSTNLTGAISAAQLAANIGVWTKAGSNVFYNSGNVGIGTNNPAGPLVVQGNAPSAIAGAITGIQTSGDVTSAGVVGVSLLPGGNGIKGEADNPLPGPAGVGGGNIGVFGLSASTNGAGVVGDALASSGLTVGVYGQSDSPQGYGGYFIGQGYFSGNLGIGTTTPNSPLAVNGNIFFGRQRNNTVFNQIGDTLYLGAEQKYLGNTLLTAVGGSTDWINLMANPLSAGIMFGTSGFSTTDPHSNITSLLVIKPNGNVGIGTSTPSSTLQVNGAVTASAFVGSGSGLTNLSSTNLTSGTIPLARLPAAIVTNNETGVNLSGTFSGTVSGTFHGNGANITNVNAATLGGVSSAGYWSTNGNAGANPANGAFLGTVDNQPLELHVNGVRVLRIQPGDPNVIMGTPPAGMQGAVSIVGGLSQNSISPGVQGATIAGGGQEQYEAFIHASGAETNFLPNTIFADFGTIGGGDNNTVNSGPAATISGGEKNAANDEYTVVGGGFQNTAEGDTSTVGGGQNNMANGRRAAIPGGDSNIAAGTETFAAGRGAQANDDGDFVWADSFGQAASVVPFASTGIDQFLIRAGGGVGINTNSPGTNALAVNGAVQITGLLREGSETGTSEAPNEVGLVTRRINSTSDAIGQVVAKSDAGGVVMTLERDGTPGGFLVRFASSAHAAVLAGTGIDRSGNAINVYKVYYNGTTGTNQIFNTSQFVGHFQLSFGDPYLTGPMTDVTFTRLVDASGNDTVNWVGTVTSTINQ